LADSPDTIPDTPMFVDMLQWYAEPGLRYAEPVRAAQRDLIEGLIVIFFAVYGQC
jgi:hypothetical protein